MAFGLLYDYLMGQCHNAYEYFGAHFLEKKVGRKKVKGVVFRLYAPMASDVSVIGEFNNWDVTQNKMDKIDEAGANQVLEKIKERNKYKVSIFYKEQNKLIDYITIEDVSK